MARHEAVLRIEAVEALLRKKDGRFVDCTYGRGGHASEILASLETPGRLMVMDKDWEAIEDAHRKLENDERVVIVHGSFKDLARLAVERDMTPLDGVLMDLGVSSPQLASHERGFSFDHDGQLDMRMDQSEGAPAKEYLSKADEDDIARVLREYGEERFARRIARAIVETRKVRPIETTSDLVAVVENAIPRREKHKHPATRTFQALRIHVNRELGDLKDCLDTVVDLLAEGGRLVIISFHSLEDRIVKRFMRDMARGDPYPEKLPIKDEFVRHKLRIVGRPVRAGKDEIERNRRARSAIMRVAERLG